MSVLELFCHVDDFWLAFGPQWYQRLVQGGTRRRKRLRRLSDSEIMTIIILFHQSQYRCFKTYYIGHICGTLRAEFPHCLSYTRFIECLPAMLGPLCIYLAQCFGRCRGLSFLDSTRLAVCHNRRIRQHRTFRGLAARGKTSVDWFFGFKLHLVVNDQGELLTFTRTPGNVDDRAPVPQFAKRLWGTLVADKGYLSQTLQQELHATYGIRLLTPRRKHRAQVLNTADRLLIRKRAIIETIIDQLKNISQIEHTRHRSPVNFLINIVGGLIAYCHQPKKPALTGRYLPAPVLP